MYSPVGCLETKKKQKYLQETLIEVKIAVGIGHAHAGDSCGYPVDDIAIQLPLEPAFRRVLNCYGHTFMFTVQRAIVVTT